jgi:glutamyl-tRNA synthetase
MSREDLIAKFSFEGVNRSNATVNFTDDDPLDPKGVWLNAEHVRALPIAELASRLLPFARAAGFRVDEAAMLGITPLIQERIRLLRDVATVADFFFVDRLPPYDPLELIPQKGDIVMARSVLEQAREILASADFHHDSLDAALRAGAQALGIKPGQMFQPVRVAVCGRKVAPPLFQTLEVMGRETALKRIAQAIDKLPKAA